MQKIILILLFQCIICSSDNYSMTSGILWNYHRVEVNHDANENNVDNNKINKNKAIRQ